MDARRLRPRQSVSESVSQVEIVSGIKRETQKKKKKKEKIAKS